MLIYCILTFVGWSHVTYKFTLLLKEYSYTPLGVGALPGIIIFS